MGVSSLQQGGVLRDKDMYAEVEINSQWRHRKPKHSAILDIF